MKQEQSTSKASAVFLIVFSEFSYVELTSSITSTDQVYPKPYALNPKPQTLWSLLQQKGISGFPKIGDPNIVP